MKYHSFRPAERLETDPKNGNVHAFGTLGVPLERVDVRRAGYWAAGIGFVLAWVVLEGGSK